MHGASLRSGGRNRLLIRCSCGPVAQWSEQGTHNPSVAGSIPAGPTWSPLSVVVRPHALDQRARRRKRVTKLALVPEMRRRHQRFPRVLADATKPRAPQSLQVSQGDSERAARGARRENHLVVAVMTSPEVQGSGASPGRDARTRNRRRAAAVIMLFVVIVAASVGALSWTRHSHARPRVFPPVEREPNEFGVASVNEQYHVGYWLQRPDLVIDDITPIVSRSSTPAATAITVCRDARSPSFGAAPGDLAAACGTLVTPHGIRLGPNDYVVATIIPLTTGIIDLRGIRVSLRAGARRWQEDTGQFVRLRVR